MYALSLPLAQLLRCARGCRSRDAALSASCAGNVQQSAVRGIKGGGTAMFALLALGGDLGCSSDPPCRNDGERIRRRSQKGILAPYFSRRLNQSDNFYKRRKVENSISKASCHEIMLSTCPCCRCLRQSTGKVGGMSGNKRTGCNLIW